MAMASLAGVGSSVEVKSVCGFWLQVAKSTQMDKKDVLPVRVFVA